MGDFVLKLSCPDRVGLLASLSGFFARHGCNLTEVHQFTDLEAGWFFTRIEFASGEGIDGGLLSAGLAELAGATGANWQLRSRRRLYRVALLCSRDGHCLADLLWRWKDGSLRFELAGVISNHARLQCMVDREGIPFVHVPVGAPKEPAFARVEQQLSDWKVDTVVLARYMQILPAAMCGRWENRIINIHHSFLPAFAGAKPYQQAWSKGVKLIGATCHYVTSVLDEGPIIEQEVVRVGHNHSPADLMRMGQDCERMALARGLSWHLEDRVFCHGGKTVVFRD